MVLVVPPVCYISTFYPHRDKKKLVLIIIIMCDLPLHKKGYVLVVLPSIVERECRLNLGYWFMNKARIIMRHWLMGLIHECKPLVPPNFGLD